MPDFKSETVTATPDTVAALFSATLADIDPQRGYQCPAWKCNACGFIAPADGANLPPPHPCAGATLATMQKEIDRLTEELARKG